MTLRPDNPLIVQSDRSLMLHTVRAVVDGTVDAFGGVDLLINNAGRVWVSLPDDDLDKTLADYEASKKSWKSIVQSLASHE